jgi:hypothetical protein
MDITNISRQNGLPSMRGDTTPPAIQQADSGSGSNSTGSDTGSGHSVPSKGYESPVLHIDSATGATVLAFLDPSGKELFQTPSRTALEYERQQALAASSGKPAKGQTTA